jgi:mannose-6-phosphate isomerase-like protein (cupin superfamily)
VRADERKHLRVSESDITWELLVPDLNRKLEVLWGEVGPGAMTPPPERDASQHVGEEVLVILEGALICWYDGEEFELRAGDSIAFDPTLPHRIENRGPDPVRMIIALTPPSF